LISAAFCQAQVSCSPPASATIVPDTWYAGVINYITITTPNFNIDNIGVYCSSVDLTTTSGAEVPVTLWENLNGGPGWTGIGVEPAASVPTEAALLVLEQICDPDDSDTPCPAGTGANGIVWKVTFPVQIIGCPAPTITSVSPDGWWAGQQQDITVTGNCFLTASDSSGPSKVTVTDGANAVTLSNVSVVSSTQITATVIVTKKAPADPAETATLKVTNTYSDGTSQSATASPAPVVLPIPVIKWRGNAISGDKAKNQSVIVGQPVELTTIPTTLPGGFTISKSTWVVPGDDIKSYTGDSSGITIDDDVDLKDLNTTFYWLYLDDPLNVTYEYCATDTSGNQLCTSPQAKATFKATRPNIDLTVTDPYNFAKMNELPARAANGSCEKRKMAWMFYGDLHYASGCAQPYAGLEGIDLTASGGDSGIYKFVQVLPTDTLSWAGPKPFQCGPYVNVLDRTFPFSGVRPLPPAAPTMAYDGPGQALPNFYSSGTRDFHAFMYLLWQPPQLSGTGTPSIPVPIGYQQWQFGGTVAQKAPIGGGKWGEAVTNAAGKVGGFTPSLDTDNAIYGYPVWGGVSGIGSCDPVDQTEEIEE
jgi:hypothetical protein